MTAWAEWEEIKTAVAEHTPASTQLNQLTPAGGSGGASGVTFSSSRKKTAANALQNDLEPGVKTHGKHAEESSESAVKEFGARDGDGWGTGSALKKALATWEKQVKALTDRLTFEKNGLMGTGTTLRGVDVGIATQAGATSKIDNI
ncbi:hypothetical protein [Streptomyces sp. C10-9-1]|uniref:hypothetical protein n=1 Tax=Streptomyces sp. C10-9-1 TaxID=1859285 RepID=UPI003D73146B